MTKYVRKSVMEYIGLQKEAVLACEGQIQDGSIVHTQMIAMETRQAEILSRIDTYALATKEEVDLLLNLLTLFMEGWLAHTDEVPVELQSVRLERVKRSMQKTYEQLQKLQGTSPRILQEMEKLP